MAVDGPVHGCMAGRVSECKLETCWLSVVDLVVVPPILESDRVIRLAIT